MLHEKVLRMVLQLPGPFSYAVEADRALLEAAKLQHPEGRVFGLQLILRYLELVSRGPIEIPPENGQGVGRVAVDVRVLVFTVDAKETLHGCVVVKSVHGYEIATKRRTVQLAPKEQFVVDMQIILSGGLQENGVSLPLQESTQGDSKADSKTDPKPRTGDRISVVVSETSYPRQTGQLGIFGDALCQETLPMNEFQIGAGDVSAEDLSQLREDLQQANRQLEELTRVFPHLEKVRTALYGPPLKSSQSLLTLLRPRAFNMKRIRMPHPWTGAADVSPLGTLSQTEPARETLQALVYLVQRSVREMRDLAESVPAVPTSGREKRVFGAQMVKSLF